MRLPAGTVWCKFTLTIIFIQNKRGSGVPVSYLFHKYEHKEVIRTWLNHLAVFMSNSPRHGTWPAPMPANFRLFGAAPAAVIATPPASPAVATNLVWNGVAAGWRSPPGTGPEAAAAYVRRGGAAATPAPPEAETVIYPEGVVAAFCPAYIICDACPKEAAAAEECVWAQGYQGHGLPFAEFVMWLVWCSWHLDQAWKRKLDEAGMCPDVPLRSIIRTQLATFRNETIVVRHWGLAARCGIARSRCPA